jgi:hypothetical protein
MRRHVVPAKESDAPALIEDPRGVSKSNFWQRQWRSRGTAAKAGIFSGLLFLLLLLCLALRPRSAAETIHIALAIDSFNTGSLIALINSTLLNTSPSNHILWHVLTGDAGLNDQIKHTVGRLLPHAQLHSHVLTVTELLNDVVVWDFSRSATLSKVRIRQRILRRSLKWIQPIVYARYFFGAQL